MEDATDRGSGGGTWVGKCRLSEKKTEKKDHDTPGKKYIYPRNVRSLNKVGGRGMKGGGERGAKAEGGTWKILNIEAI